MRFRFLRHLSLTLLILMVSGAMALLSAATASFSVNNSSQCSNGNSFTFTNNSTGSGTLSYSWDFGDNTTSTQATPPAKMYAGAGTYVVKLVVTDNAGSDSTTLTVTVRETPVNVTASSNSPVCAGDTLKLFSTTTTAGTSVSWSGAAGSFTVPNPVVPNVQTVQGGTYTVTYTKGSCSTSATTTVQVKQRPLGVVGSVARIPVCAGDTIKLRGTSSTSQVAYSWTGPNSYSAQGQNPMIYNASSLDSGVYTLTVSKNGCSATDTALVTINPKPSAGFVSDGYIKPRTASGFVFTPTSNPAGNTYTWSYGDTSTSTVGQTGAPGGHDYADTGSYRVRVIVTSSAGCTDTSSQLVRVIPGMPTTCSGVHYLYYTSASDSAHGNPPNPNTLPSTRSPIWVWDPSLPYSSTNPHATGIIAPLYSGGLAFGRNLTTATPPYTFYTTISNSNQSNSTYWYFDGTNWVSTGHDVSGTASTGLAAVNMSTSGKYIFNIDGVSGHAYRYNGRTTGTDIGQIPNWVSNSGYYDTHSDCNDYWYISLGTTTTNGLQKMDSANRLMQSWSYNVTGLGGAGIVLIDDYLYLDGGRRGRPNYKGQFSPSATTITLSNFPELPRNGGFGFDFDDWAACALGLEDLQAAPRKAYYCAGSTTGATIQAIHGPVPYSWTIISGSGTIANPSAATTTITLTSDSARVRLSSGQSCTADTIMVYRLKGTVDAGPAFDSLVCGRISDTLHATISDTTRRNPAVGYRFTWSPTSFITSGANTLNPVIRPSTAPGGTKYYFTLTTPFTMGNCAFRDSITAVVIDRPDAPTVTSPVTYCRYANAMPLTAGGQNLRWYDSASGGTGTSTAPTPNTNDTGSRLYYVSQTIAGCEGRRAVIRVTVTNIDAPGVMTPVIYCVGNPSDSLSATGSPGATFRWYTVATGGTPVVTGGRGPKPSTATAMDYDYYVEQVTGSCVSPRSHILVRVVNSTPPPEVRDTILCQNTPPYTLTANGQNLKWFADSMASSAPLAGAPTIQTNTIATYVYYVSQTLSCGESARARITANVQARPSRPTVTIPPAYCKDAPASPLMANGQNLRWYHPLGTLVQTGTPGPTPSTATPGGPDNYYVTQTVNGCQSDSSIIPVYVNIGGQRPSVRDTSVCVNSPSFNVTASGGANYKWYRDSSGGSPVTTGATGPSVSTQRAGDTTFYVTSTPNGGCESDRQRLVVTVEPLPAKPQGLDVTYCQGNPADTLMVLNGQEIKWYAPPNYVPATRSPRPTTTSTGVTNYFVTQSVNGCESPKDTITVTVVTQPNAPSVGSTNSMTYCHLETASPLVASGGASNSTYRWYAGTNSTVPLSGAPTPNTSRPDTTYYYQVSQVSNGNCESPRTLVTINVLSAIPIPTVSPLRVCEGSDMTLTTSAQNPTWNPGGGSAPHVYPNTPAGSTNYSVYDTRIQSGRSCNSQTYNFTLTVNAKPRKPTTSSTPIGYCQFDQSKPLNQSALPSGGGTLYWYSDTNSRTPYDPTVNVSTSTIGTRYYFVSQRVNDCEGPYATITVVISAKPTVSVKTTSTVVCQYGRDTFWNGGVTPPNSTISWKITNGVEIGRFGDTLIARFDSSGSAAVALQITTTGCKSDTSRMTIRVDSAAVVSIVSDSIVCDNQPSRVEVSYKDVFINSTSWNFAGGSVVYGNQAGPYLIRWPGAGRYIISLDAIANGCRLRTVFDTITVNPSPGAQIEGYHGDEVCTGSDVLLHAVPRQNNFFYHYEWTPMEQFGNGRGVNQLMDSAYATVTSSQFIHLKVTDIIGCSSKDSIFINTKPCCEVYVPTAFSPNNDGRNDRFQVVTGGYHRIVAFRVMNRWGQIVYETSDEREGWDGTLNGKPQEVGVYYYYLRYKCSNDKYFDKQGEISLIR